MDVSPHCRFIISKMPHQLNRSHSGRLTPHFSCNQLPQSHQAQYMHGDSTKWKCYSGHPDTLDTGLLWTGGNSGHMVTLDTGQLWTQGDSGHGVTLDTGLPWTWGYPGHGLTLDTKLLWAWGNSGHPVTLDTQ